MKRETAQDIEEKAAEWAAKADRGLSREEQSCLESWLQDDSRRLGAYGRMRAISAQTERAAAFGSGYDPSNFSPDEAEPRFVARRRFLIGGSAMAASVAGIAAFGWQWLHSGQQTVTRKGEVRQLALQDGSVITLNTDSVVSVSLTEQRRDIRLLRGEALFDVAHDPQRPFVVSAGPARIQAIGTSFTVRLAERDVRVLVREGIVSVRDGKGASAMRLPANMRAVVSVEAGMPSDSSGLGAASLPVSDVHRELAWKDGNLAFEGETLRAAADEFARYSDTRIVIKNPALAAEQIAGLYRSNDPVGFAQSVAQSLGARAVVGDGEVLIQ